jgi:glycosyltransferase involved in cell wall biosynthesis
MGAEDLFTDGVEGFIVPIRNPEAIREKMLHLYENPILCERMGLAALRRVQALMGWDTYGANAATVFANALGQRQGAARQQSSKIIVERCG